MRFVSLDVETANPDMSSICQIGIVIFENGEVVDSWSTLVDPEDYFDDLNVSIHGINQNVIAEAPNFKQASIEAFKRISGQVVAIHGSFDSIAISKASDKHGISPPECYWLNTTSVARRAWPEVSKKGYGLAALSQKFGFEFIHHNALEDAKAAGLILLKAITDTKLDLNEWIEKVKRPMNKRRMNSSPKKNLVRTANPDGPLFGEIAVFTGMLSISRGEASDIAATSGCEVAESVTKHTTLLIVGDQDIRLLRGREKSSKHRKAEELIKNGAHIRILTESDFAALTMIS